MQERRKIKKNRSPEFQPSIIATHFVMVKIHLVSSHRCPIYGDNLTGTIKGERAEKSLTKRNTKLLEFSERINITGKRILL
jgi:hypothetical protein